MKKILLICALIGAGFVDAYALDTLLSTDTGAQMRTKVNGNFSDHETRVAAVESGKADKSAVIRYWSDWPDASPGNTIAVDTIVAYDGKLYACTQEFVKTAGATPAAFTSYFSEVPGSGGSYTLPTASAETLGGIKVGDRLTIADGVLSADVQSGGTAADIAIADLDELFTATSVETALKENRELINAGTAGYSDENAQDAVGGMFSGNTETGIAITYDDANAKINAVVDFTGLASVYEPLKGADDNYVTDAEKVVIGNTSGTNTGDQDLSGKQDVLVSGTSIKTINSTSLLGSGNIEISGGSMTWPSAAGVAVYGGSSAWGTSLTVGTSANNLVQLNGSGQLPAVSAALLTNFPTLNQNTTGTAGGLSGTPDITVDDIYFREAHSTAADGAQYGEITNTVAITATATLGRYAWLTDRFWIANGTNWTSRWILDSSMIGAAGGVQAYDADLDDDAIEFVIDGGGSAITTGVKGFIEIPWNATVNRATVVCDQSGSIVVDIWQDTYANFPPTDADSITASAPPTLSTAQASQDSTLTGWTTSLTAGSIVGYNVDSVSTVELCTVSLKVTK